MKEHEKVILDKVKAYAAQAIQFKGEMEFQSFQQTPRP